MTYRDSSANLFGIGEFKFNTCVSTYCGDSTVPADQRNYVMQISLMNRSKLFKAVRDFAKRNKVNVHNLVKWQEGHDLAAWKAQDKEVYEKAQKAESSFAVIRKLIKDEIVDIENMENGTSQWTGDENDPVYDPEDQAIIKDPDSAAKKAWAKWRTMKVNLRNKLKEVDAAAEALRNEWQNYKNAVASFEMQRAKCIDTYFSLACLRIIGAAKDLSVLDAGHDANFKIPAGYMSYDIGKGTRDMLASINAYQTKINEAYDREVEYGAMLGLQSASKAKREGKRPDEIVDEADKINEDTPGSLAPGSDTGSIIDKDHQEYSGGAWQWK